MTNILELQGTDFKGTIVKTIQQAIRNMLETNEKKISNKITQKVSGRNYDVTSQEIEDKEESNGSFGIEK